MSEIILPKNWDKLSEQEKREWISQIKEETYQQEEKPLTGVFEEFEMVATDVKGKKHKIGAMTKGVIRAEKFKKKQKRPDLIHVCSIANIKIYYNVVSEEFWMLVLKPLWVKHKRMMKEIAWIKLEEHDFETMKVLSILYERDFNNPLPQTFWIKKKEREKAKRIMVRFKMAKTLGIL